MFNYNKQTHFIQSGVSHPCCIKHLFGGEIIQLSKSHTIFWFPLTVFRINLVNTITYLNNGCLHLDVLLSWINLHVQNSFDSLIVVSSFIFIGEFWHCIFTYFVWENSVSHFNLRKTSLIFVPQTLKKIFNPPQN